MKDFEVIRKGSTDMLLLTLLRERDMYGYELKKQIADRSDGQFGISEGSMYIFLYRMSERGYISERRELAGKRRVRVYYHLEPKGVEYLEEMERDFVPASEGLMKFYERSKKLLQESK